MNITYDKTLDLALGNSRKTKTWKNRQMQWSELVKRLSTTTRTPETMAEYRAMSQSQQADIKDVGGFVGGYCAEGSRTSVTARSLVCLDADFADSELWDDWGLLYGNAAVVYSTHKHTLQKPRLRLVIPLSREVTPDEYPAIGRRIAATLGIDKFDNTTYDVGRLMYWPSTSQDGEFVFEYMDAPLLNPDTVLATYRDWKDISSWPMSSSEAEIVKKTATKMGDPLEKGGLIGAFCRAYYPISEAIEAFIPTYQPCDEPNRYTYTEGSTAAGVVIYEDKFSFSHHGTDPASGQSLNAWDLVRVHKFHAMDEGCDPGTPTSSRPSYKAMAQMAAEDSRVKAQLVNDRKAEADIDFSEPLENGDWQSKLKYTEKGVIAQTIDNAVIILSYDPEYAGSLAVNEMEHNIVAVANLPWKKTREPRQWVDSDDAALRHRMEQVYSLTGRDRIYDAVNIVAQRNSFHPVREYLDSCIWDGIPRVETLLVDYLGAEDSPYTRAVTRKTLVAAVARIYNPGCKFDYMLTLRGRQGIGKSALIAKLGGKWFSDSFTTLSGKDAYEQVLGVWLVEVGELAGMRKAEAETIKLYISKQSDRFRPAYGRRIEEFPRQCVFIGTTNETQFLRDTTGNRRFWVVDTPNKPSKDMWEDLTPEVVKLIWGEAVEIYKAGEPLYLSKELEAVARATQETYEEENPRAGLVAEYLDRKLPAGWEDMDLYSRRSWLETNAEGTEERTVVCTLEIWAEALGGNPDKFDRYAGKEVRDILAGMPEWRHMGNLTRTIKPYGRQRYFVKEER